MHTSGCRVLASHLEDVTAGVGVTGPVSNGL
jgi:hypothetical protein